MRRQQFRSTQTALRNSTNSTDPSQLVHSFDYGLNPSRPAKSSPLGSSAIAGLPLELLDRLRAFPLFVSAPESFLLHIGRSLRPSIFLSSQEIIREGEDSKAMYWLVRGSVKVTSRDGESTYAELKPGAFFGEIGILMDIPRTASIVATVKSLVVRLNKEDLRKELPNYPEVEKAIREEALERLAILERKKREGQNNDAQPARVGIVDPSTAAPPRKRSRDWVAGDVEMGEAGSIVDGPDVFSNKRRKSPSPGITELAASSALGTEPPLTVRQLLKELPLFAGLPNEILHYLGVNAQPITFAPFVEILRQGSAGRDVYFIIKGEVEILTRAMEPGTPTQRARQPPTSPSSSATHLRFRARLKAGQYFGEVTSLSLSPRRTATVRSIDAVECLMISGEVLDDLWRRCSPALKQQVEIEARRRLDAANIDQDADMPDVAAGATTMTMTSTTARIMPPHRDDDQQQIHWRAALPTVKFDDKLAESLASQMPKMEPSDPDPFFNPDLDNMRAKSRRSSLAPPTTTLADAQQQSTPLLDTSRTPSPPIARLQASSPLRPRERSSPSLSIQPSPTFSRRPSLVRIASNIGRGRLPDSVIVQICQNLALHDLMRARLISMHWHNLISTSPDLLHDLDLAMYNKRITDLVLRDYIVPFVGVRPRRIDLSNCFHITDDGFKMLAESCGAGVTMWKMKSVWEVSGPAVLLLVDKAKSLEEIDLSNCRKVGDNLLARVVGWIVPERRTSPVPPTNALPSSNNRPQPARTEAATQQPSAPAPGTAIGASQLKRLTLSYCKHIQDRSMAHIAMHASNRLESLDLTRCTSISDAGFQSWGMYNFRNMRRLVLADCTYLTDQAIVGIVGGCRGLLELDLSFCCALSDTATEVLALGLPALRRLNMAFCGSAVSDNSMRCMGLHLLELRYLSVRGCVRVTGQGVESVIEGCSHLEEFDVSQCRNLKSWIDRGGIRIVHEAKPRGLGRNIVFDIVADGTWRTAR